MTDTVMRWPSRGEYLRWRLAEWRDLPGIGLRMRSAGRTVPGGWTRAVVRYGDDPEQRMVVTVPAGDGEPFAVLFVHGGSWRSGAPEDYGFVGSWFAKRGIASGVTGYRHMPAHTWPAQRDDVFAALATLAERSGATRFVLAGHSAGAHLAAAALYDRDARRAEGMADDTVLGLVAMSGPLDFEVICPQRRYCPLIDDLLGGLDDWSVADPAALMRPGDSWPVLLMHGARDPLVNVASSVSFAGKAADAGAPTELVVEERVGHAGMLGALLGDRELEGRLERFLDLYAGGGPGRHPADLRGKDDA